jgi:hypothetical protein
VSEVKPKEEIKIQPKLGNGSTRGGLAVGPAAAVSLSRNSAGPADTLSRSKATNAAKCASVHSSGAAGRTNAGLVRSHSVAVILKPSVAASAALPARIRSDAAPGASLVRSTSTVKLCSKK